MEIWEMEPLMRASMEIHWPKYEHFLKEGWLPSHGTWLAQYQLTFNTEFHGAGIMFTNFIVLVVSFFICSSIYGELHTDSAKSKQIERALLTIGDITEAELKEIADSPKIYPKKLLYMIDPLIHRQGSPEPLKAALPGFGFSTREEMKAIMDKNPNADVFPKTNTRFWSKELKRKLLPVLKQESIGTQNKTERDLTAAQMLSFLTLARISDVPPFPGEDVSKRVKLSETDWQELRDQIGELALAYQKTIADAKNSGANDSPRKATHR